MVFRLCVNYDVWHIESIAMNIDPSSEHYLCGACYVDLIKRASPPLSPSGIHPSSAMMPISQRQAIRWMSFPQHSIRHKCPHIDTHIEDCDKYYNFGYARRREHNMELNILFEYIR